MIALQRYESVFPGFRSTANLRDSIEQNDSYIDRSLLDTTFLLQMQ